MPETTKASMKTVMTRIVVSVLFGLLILSFAIWGIGDIFRRGHVSPVAEIGPVRVTMQEFQAQYQREVRRLQTMLQTNIDAQRARELRLPERVLQDMVSRILFDLAARDAGVAVGDDVVRQAIAENPAFHDAQGKFDRRIFENQLYNAGYNEDGFVALMRADLARSQLSDAITAGAVVPAALLDSLYRYRNERRVAETLFVAAASIKTLPAPSEADLDAYHKAHAEVFTAPEYRAVTMVEMRPQDLAASLSVSEDKLKDEYQARAAEFTLPETRMVRQILLPDEAAAKRAEELLVQGQSFDKVAQDTTGKPPAELGAIRQSDSAAGELGKAAFEAKEGTVTAPIKTSFGWHILQVVKVVPGRTQSLEEVKDKLTKELALHEANDAVFELGNKLQDALGGGAALEEAAQKLKLPLVKLDAVDGHGDGPDGKPVAHLPASPKFLSTAFSAEAGRESDLIDDGAGGYFMLRVDKVVPSQLRPLAAVRDKVLAGWQEDERQKAAEKLAGTLVEKARSGVTLADLAKTGDYRFATTTPFTRDGAGTSELTPALVAALFAAKSGEVVTAPGVRGAMVAKLIEIKPAEEKTDQVALDRLRAQLLGAIDSDLLAAFSNQQRSRYGVSIDRATLDQLAGS